MSAWLERFKGMALAACAVVALFVLAYLRGRGAGRAAEREQHDARINQQADRAREEVRNVHDETARMDDAGIADELKRDWVRGASPRRR